MPDEDEAAGMLVVTLPPANGGNHNTEILQRLPIRDFLASLKPPQITVLHAAASKHLRR